MIEYEQQDLLDENDIKEWSENTSEKIIMTLPPGHQITIEDINKTKNSTSMKAFLNWLEAANDDDEDEDDDDDEED